jgi:hypothetical protein
MAPATVRRPIKLLSDIILVHVDQEELLECGLYAPAEAQPGNVDIAEKHALMRTGTVVHSDPDHVFEGYSGTGPGLKSKKCARLTMAITVGDRVVFSAWVGTNQAIYYGWGNEYLLMRESEVLGKLESKTERKRKVKA